MWLLKMRYYLNAGVQSQDPARRKRRREDRPRLGPVDIYFERTARIALGPDGGRSAQAGSPVRGIVEAMTHDVQRRLHDPRQPQRHRPVVARVDGYGARARLPGVGHGEAERAAYEHGRVRFVRV